MRFGEGSDLRFALSAIVGPNTGQVRFVIAQCFAFFNSLAIRLASIFIAAGQKTFGFKGSTLLRNGPLRESPLKEFSVELDRVFSLVLLR